MSALFSPLTLREVTFKNRIFVSPMCQYSSEDGMPSDWHLVHLGSRAVGGSALVMAEATAVSPEGRITPADAGIWSDRHAAAFRRITDFIRSQNAVPAIQIAHAGRKASTAAPSEGGHPLTGAEGGWETLAPSAVPFDERHPTPRAMSAGDIEAVTEQFVEAARRSREAGFDAVEIHMAHGYLLHEFLSPLSNRRDDDWGGSLENRMRLPLAIARAVRALWPPSLPVFVRVSATDWVEQGGWDLPQTIELSRRLRDLGVDLIDCSTGGNVPGVRISAHPGYQVPFAAAVRREAEVATGAVGLLTDPQQAERIVAGGDADVVLLARELLRNPYWPLHAARVLGADIPWPVQYQRAKH